MAQGKQSVEQRKEIALQNWVNNPNSTYEEIAAMSGISYKTFYRYRKDEEFMEQYKKLCQQRFKSLEAKAVAALEQQIDEKNFNAIKYALDGLGYKATDKVDATVDSKQTIKIVIEE